MKCWCKEIESYICSNCEKNNTWRKLSFEKKLDLLAYKDQLQTGDIETSLAFRILDNNLCVSMIPENPSL